MIFVKNSFARVLVLVLALIQFSCGKEDQPPVFEADPAGQWYKGDVHVHSTGASNDTGGDSWPGAIAEQAIALGLDFVVLTDHSNSTGSDPSTTVEDSTLFNMGPEFPWWDSVAILSQAGVFLMVNGNEISPLTNLSTPLQPTGHIGCLPSASAFNTSVVFIDRPDGAISGGNALSQANAAGCFSVLNHPYSFAPWLRYDWTNYDYDAMEIWNGTSGLDEWDKMAYDAWRCDLMQGREVTAVGGSDNHRVNIVPPGGGGDPALGYPFTYVFAANLDWPSISAALEDGKTAIGEGESFVGLDVYSETGDRTTAEDAHWLRLRATADALVEGGKVDIYRAYDFTDTRPNPLQGVEIIQEVVASFTIAAGESLDENILMNGKNGLFTAILSTTNDEGHYSAISGALIIE